MLSVRFDVSTKKFDVFSNNLILNFLLFECHLCCFQLWNDLLRFQRGLKTQHCIDQLRLLVMKPLKTVKCLYSGIYTWLSFAHRHNSWRSSQKICSRWIPNNNLKKQLLKELQYRYFTIIKENILNNKLIFNDKLLFFKLLGSKI